MSRGMLIATKLGPTDHPKCPECGNSFQNATPDGSSNCLRCADCKCVFEVPEMFGYLSDELTMLRDDNKRLRRLVAMAIKNARHIPETHRNGDPGAFNGPLWARCSQLFGLGSTSAHALCHEFGEDPEWKYIDQLSEISTAPKTEGDG